MSDCATPETETSLISEQNETGFRAIDPTLFRRLDDLKQERKANTKRGEELTAEIDRLQDELVEQYVAAGKAIEEVDGRIGSYVPVLYARKIDPDTPREKIAEALIAAGKSHLVTPPSYNANQLSAWVRRLEEEGKPIPDPVAELVEGVERYEIRFTSRRPSRARARLDGASSSVLDGASQG